MSSLRASATGAILTDLTFARYAQGVLGLGCGKYQPEPKRVVGIKRAIAVASSSHHTLVLQSATLPTLPLADVFFSPDPTTQQQQQLEESDSAESTDTDNMGDGADDDEEEDSVGTMRTRGQAAPRGVVGMRARRARVSPQQRSSPSSSDSDNDDAHGGVDGRGEGPADGLGDASQGLCVRAVPSLKDLCQRRLAEGVDLKNAVQVVRDTRAGTEMPIDLDHIHLFLFVLLSNATLSW